MEEDEFDAVLQRAIDLAGAEHYVQSAALLRTLIARAPGSKRLAPVQWYLGSLLLHQLDDPVGAESFFRQASAAAPWSERASLGLFHTLIGQHRVDEAFDEMRRFLALRDSKGYRRLLDEINAKGGDEFLAWYDGPTEAVLRRDGRWWYASMVAWRPAERSRIFVLVPADEQAVVELKRRLAEFERDEKAEDWVRLREAVRSFLSRAGGRVEVRLCDDLLKPPVRTLEVDFEEVAPLIGKDVESVLAMDAFDALRAKFDA